MAAPTTQANTLYDLFIIGGGINGAGIARDAAGRGLSVFLCEKDDLAQATSSSSSKMLHGGLRYLEFYEFRLVRAALLEREVLLNSAPHIIWPMEFVLPSSPGMRPNWMLRIGLFIYDHLASRRRLPASYRIDLHESRFGKPLKKFLQNAFVYSDCWVEDARLVVLTALSAARHGATIAPYTRFIKAQRESSSWRIVVERNGQESVLHARHLVNAAGPGLARVAERIEGAPDHPVALRLVKGSHIIVPRLYDGEHAYILQHSDRRMIFILPYENDFSLIGTTDIPASDLDIDHPKISEAEMDYLLDAVNQYFVRYLTRQDITHSYSGVRPLFDDGEVNASRVTRDYNLTLDHDCLSVFGGKITTFRKLAEQAVDMIVTARGETVSGKRAHWTEKDILPGGNIGPSLAMFTQKMVERYSFLPEEMVTRMASQYGTRIHSVLRDVTSIADMGTHLGDTLFAREVDFLRANEWAACPEDILLRRTKLEMHVSGQTRRNLAAYLQPGAECAPFAEEGLTHELPKSQ